MLKLVAVGDLEKLLSTGDLVCYIEKKTIITPAANDFASEHGIKFSYDKQSASPVKAEACCECKRQSKDCNSDAHSFDINIEPKATGVDYDLQSLQEARDLVSLGYVAAEQIASYTNEQIDRILQSMVNEARKYNVKFAEMAVDETGFGNIQDKTYKNHLATSLVYEAIKDMKTIGVIEEDALNKVTVLAEPMGLLLGIIPSTNPTSTAMFKSIISIKARNSIVFSPHPSALKCTLAAAELMRKAAVAAGAPENIIGCLSKPSVKSTDEMMKSDKVKLIIATGGPGLVKASYSSGKPALGVGAGNTPVYIEKSADIKKAVSDIIASKTFDYGTICASEQSIIVEECIRNSVVAEFKRQGCYFMNNEETGKVCDLIFADKHTMNAKFVGRSADVIAQAAGIDVPSDTKILIGEQFGVGDGSPLSYEKLTSVLAFYTVRDWEEACHLCVELLQNGIGHTLSLHTRNDDIVKKFSVKPASRILVNTGASQGSTGASTGLIPSFTLGCGTWGGSSVSENVSPLHLINIKRVAYGIKDCLTLIDNDPLFNYDIPVSKSRDAVEINEAGKNDCSGGNDNGTILTSDLKTIVKDILTGDEAISAQELDTIVKDIFRVLKEG